MDKLYQQRVALELRSFLGKTCYGSVSSGRTYFLYIFQIDEYKNENTCTHMLSDIYLHGQEFINLSFRLKMARVSLLLCTGFC